MERYFFFSFFYFVLLYFFFSLFFLFFLSFLSVSGIKWDGFSPVKILFFLKKKKKRSFWRSTNFDHLPLCGMDE